MCRGLGAALTPKSGKILSFMVSGRSKQKSGDPRGQNPGYAVGLGTRANAMPDGIRIDPDLPKGDGLRLSQPWPAGPKNHPLNYILYLVLLLLSINLNKSYPILFYPACVSSEVTVDCVTPDSRAGTHNCCAILTYPILWPSCLAQRENEYPCI